jgi:hypothetical protein
MPPENALSRLLQSYLAAPDDGRRLAAIRDFRRQQPYPLNEATPASPPEGHGREVRPAPLKATSEPAPHMAEVP